MGSLLFLGKGSHCCLLPAQQFGVYSFLQGEVTIHYNKLQADPKQGKSLDIGKTGFFLPRILKLCRRVKDWTQLKPT